MRSSGFHGFRTPSLLWLVLCGSEGALAPLSPEVECALGTAAQEVTQMTRKFERLRREMSQVPRSTVERLLEGLSSSEIDLLRGQGDGKVLEDRFEELQRQGQSLLTALRCEDNSSEEDGFSLLEVPEMADADLEDANDADSTDRREDIEEEDAEDAELEDDEDIGELEELEEEETPEDVAHGLDDVGQMPSERCLSASNVTGYLFTEVSLELGNFSVLVECLEPSFTGEAEVVPCDQPWQEYQLHGCWAARCSMAEDPKGYVITEASLVYQDFDVSAKCASGYEGEAKVESCQRPGDPYHLSGCSAMARKNRSSCAGNWTSEKVDSYIQRLQSLAEDLTSHFQLLSSFSNVSAVPLTSAASSALLRLKELRQRLPQRLPAQRQGAMEVLRRVGAQAALLDPRSPENDEDFERMREELETAMKRLEEPSPVDRSSPVTAATGATGATSGSRRSCDLQGIQRANERFDEAVSNFRSILPKMLPREVESLHRVLHSMEVLRHTLSAMAEPAECERYFSGVEQLESDLAHYRSLFNPPSDVPKTPAPRKAVPLRPGQLEPLQLELGKGPSAFQRPAAPLPTGPALDARGFR